MTNLKDLKIRCFLLQILDALEQAGINPISAKKLHSFAYLANVLSPIWEVRAFENIVLKDQIGPHYQELQKQIDVLVGMGLAEVSNLHYNLVEGGALIEGDYELRLNSPHLHALLAALGSDEQESSLDDGEYRLHKYLVELANALTVLPDDEIDVVAKIDETYLSDTIDYSNVIDFSKLNRSVELTTKFEDFLPNNSGFSPVEKIFLYASYLNRKLSA